MPRRPPLGAAFAWLGLALCACAPGGQIALSERAAGGSGAAPSCVGNAGGSEPVADLAPDPSSDPALAGARHRYFKISVLDATDRTPIAGATLSTLNDVVYTSDDNGVVAYYEPGLMGRKVWFTPLRDGYTLAADGFGYRGKTLQVEEGGSGEILLTRSATSAVSASAGDLETRKLQGPVPNADACFGIRVIDQMTKRGVPLVTLATTDESFVSDSQGFVADCNPDHQGSQLSYAVTSHGYQFAAGSLDLRVTAGEVIVIEINRTNLAERLYRSTGQGIYRDSVLLGLTTPVERPVLNGGVMSQDSVGAVVLDGGLFWSWGTTTSPDYPLSNFGAAGALSDLPTQGGLDPRLGVNTRYIADKSGNSRALSPNIAPTSLPTWLSSSIVVPDANGEDQAFAVFAKPNANLSFKRRGLVRFDKPTQSFVDAGVGYPLGDFVAPSGQPVLVRHAARTYAYFASAMRVLATAEALADPSSYEVFSALPAHGGKTAQRGPDGSLSYGFKAGALATTADVVQAAKLGSDQALDGHLADMTTGTVFDTTGSAAQSYSEHRQRFLRLVEQVSGTTSYLGELWYAEGDTPMGPWVYARKVVTHDKYSFSTPWLHSYFEQEGGRFVFFEGTYTSSFAGNGVINTPRYNHNQLLYRLDLDEPELALPVAQYDTSDGARQRFASKAGLAPTAPPLAALFFAPDRPAPDTVPVYWSGPSCVPRQLLVGGTAAGPALFYAVARDDSTRAGNLVALYDFANATGQHAYDTDPQATLPGFARAGALVAYVWPSPISVKLPVSDYLGPLTADAGADQCVSESRAGSGADVVLDGSNSSSDSNAPLSFSWLSYDEGCSVGSSPTLALHLAAGDHTFQLTVTDGQGHARSAQVRVLISSVR